MLFPERNVACPRCGSWNTKNRGSWDKCYDCGKRWGVMDEDASDPTFPQPLEIPKLAEKSSSASNTQAMKHARELKEARVALYSAGLPQKQSGRYVPEEIFKQLYAQIVEQVPSVSWIGDKAPTYCPACHCHGPGWDVIESPSGRTYDLLLCNSCGVVLAHEAVAS